MDLITTHVNADFDALASVIAAQKLYPGAVAVLPGAQERNVRDFMKSSSWAFDVRKPKDVDLDAVTRLILVDTKDPRRIGPAAGILDRPGLEIHIYDHHPRRDDDIRGSFEQIEEAGSVSTLMVETLDARGIRLSPVEATVLALGIYEETGCFSFPSTGERDFRAMAHLMKQGANLNVVKTYLGKEPSPEQFELLHELLRSSREYAVSGYLVHVAKASRETYIPDAAMLTHKLRDMTDCDALFVLLRMEDRIHIIGRSRVARINVAEALAPLGGGGHAYAAAAVTQGNSLERIEEEVIASLRKTVRPEKTAADVMTSPVKCLPSGATLTEAQEAMTRYGFNVMPVLKGEQFSGVISREVVERAIHHGFERREVSAFATTDPITATPETPIFEVEAMMVERNRKFVPVLEGQRVVGAITRTDLIRVLYEDLLRRSRPEDGEFEPAERPGASRNIRGLIEEKFPERIVGLLRQCGRTAEEMGYHAYLVGGSVRDLLRNEKNLDLDIVVEGHGIRFARRLAGAIGGRVRSHDRFNTAVIVLSDGFKLDVATARTEFYESPGVLPTVEASSIKKDLYRRDFTINTLAVRLDEKHFGQLLDFFGGQRDLKDRTIRILHNLSFIEDPTRAFRAIRFALRFGFRIGRHTANLIQSAIRMNLMEKIAGTRLYDELVLLFSETSPALSVRELNRFHLLQCIHPSIRHTPHLQDLLERLEKVVAWVRLLYLEDRIAETDLSFMALLWEMKEPAAAAVVEEMALPVRVRERIGRQLGQAKSALYRLSHREHTARNIFHALHGMSLEGLLLALAATRDEAVKKAISTFITDLRHTAPLLTGKELTAMGYTPGPRFQEIFRAILDARLEGRLVTKYDETRFVRENFKA